MGCLGGDGNGWDRCLGAVGVGHLRGRGGGLRRLGDGRVGAVDRHLGDRRVESPGGGRVGSRDRVLGGSRAGGFARAVGGNRIGRLDRALGSDGGVGLGGKVGLGGVGGVRGGSLLGFGALLPVSDLLGAGRLRRVGGLRRASGLAGVGGLRRPFGHLRAAAGLRRVGSLRSTSDLLGAGRLRGISGLRHAGDLPGIGGLRRLGDLRVAGDVSRVGGLRRLGELGTVDGLHRVGSLLDDSDLRRVGGLRRSLRSLDNLRHLGSVRHVDNSDLRRVGSLRHVGSLLDNSSLCGVGELHRVRGVHSGHLPGSRGRPGIAGLRRPARLCAIGCLRRRRRLSRRLGRRTGDRSRVHSRFGTGGLRRQRAGRYGLFRRRLGRNALVRRVRPGGLRQRGYLSGRGLLGARFSSLHTARNPGDLRRPGLGVSGLYGLTRRVRLGRGRRFGDGPALTGSHVRPGHAHLGSLGTRPPKSLRGLGALRRRCRVHPVVRVDRLDPVVAVDDLHVAGVAGRGRRLAGEAGHRRLGRVGRANRFGGRGLGGDLGRAPGGRALRGCLGLCVEVFGAARRRSGLPRRRSRGAAVGEGADRAGGGVGDRRAEVQRAALRLRGGRRVVRRREDGRRRYRRRARVGQADTAEVDGAAVTAGRLVRARLVDGFHHRFRSGWRHLVAPRALGTRQQQVFVLGGSLGEVGVRTVRGDARLLHHACALRLPLARDLAGVGHAYPSPIG